VSTFWAAAAAVLLAVVAALCIPLLRRSHASQGADQDRANVALYHDQLAELTRDYQQEIISKDQFEQARLELDQRLLADVPEKPREGPGYPPVGAWRFVAVACVPVCAILAYLVLGTPEALDRASIAKARGAPDSHNQNLGQLTERLAARLAANPQDAEAWVLLARSYQMLERTSDAVKAFAKAIELIPGSAQLHADYADVQVAATNGQWTDSAIASVAKALAIDGSHPKALWLAGTEAYVRKDFPAALAYWQKLLPLAEPGSEAARMIQANIAEVRGLMGGIPGQVASQTAPAASPAAAVSQQASQAATQIAGTIALDPAIAAKAQAPDTVFIFARAATGPKMPLAIRRVTVKDLPYEFVLDDSHAMAPGMAISAFEQVVVGARVSRSGDATPKPGDLEGLSPPVKPGTKGVAVRINATVQ
jgi:cytochrome c-type biogenesis protein CcmH